MKPSPTSWHSVTEGWSTQVIPNADYVPHVLHVFNTTGEPVCWCRPEVEYSESKAMLECGIEGHGYQAIVLHNAMDRRDYYELDREGRYH